MANKMTKKDFFNILKESYPIDAENFDDVMAFLDNEIKLLEKKATANDKKKAENGKINAEIKENLLEVITDEKKTATEIVKAYNDNFGTAFSIQKISPLLVELVEDKLIVRKEEKRKGYYTIV